MVNEHVNILNKFFKNKEKERNIINLEFIVNE